MTETTCPFCGATLKKKDELHNCKGGKPGVGDRLDERVDQAGPPEPRVTRREDNDDGLPPAA